MKACANHHHANTGATKKALLSVAHSILLVLQAHDLNNPYYSSQQYHDWYNHNVQYYGQYLVDHPAPQYVHVGCDILKDACIYIE